MTKLEFTCPYCIENKEVLIDQDKSKFCILCKTDFSVKNNIPRLTQTDNYADSFGFQWNIFRKTQLDSHVSKPISRDRLYEVTKWVGNLKGQNILEAGSGAGRFTEVLVETNANIYSFDYSNAVEANYLNNGQNSNLVIFQGDIYKIPFPDDTFDHIICLGVLQHTPNPKESFVSLSRKLKVGGYLYIDIYTKSFRHNFQWKYFLRPLTKRLSKNFLYSLIKTLVPLLIPLTKLLKNLFGKYGAVLSPIKEYSELDIGKENNKAWAILDTFDMYSPEHDHPQKKENVESWFQELGFSDVSVWYGKNGVVGRGRK